MFRVRGSYKEQVTFSATSCCHARDKQRTIKKAEAFLQGQKIEEISCSAYKKAGWYFSHYFSKQQRDGIRKEA